LRVGEQKHVVVTDDYYIFTREAASERLLIVFYKGEASKTIDVDLTDTSIFGAKGFTLLNAGPAATVEASTVRLQLVPQTVAIYRID